MADLTDAHKVAIRESWQIISKDLKQNAVSLYIDYLFPKYPATRAMFKSLECISDDQLAAHPKMRATAVRFFYTFSSMIDNLDDLEVVVDQLDKTVRDHMRYNVTYEHYQALLEDVIPSWLKGKLGDKWSKMGEESWTILVQFMLSCIKTTLELCTDTSVNLFPKYPATRAMFKNLDGISDDELAAHPKMRAHGVRVLYTISSLIDNLDDLEVVVDQLDKTVRDHIRYDIAYAHYEALLSDVIPAWLKKKMGDNWNETTEESWTLLVNIMLSCIKTTLELWSDTEKEK